MCGYKFVLQQKPKSLIFLALKGIRKYLKRKT